MNQGKVLVVEDDPSLREVLSETLLLAGYEVVAAENGQQAMRCLQQSNDIALMVSDVQMKPMDGHMLLKLARARFGQLPIIMMTAYATVEKAVQAIHQGANDYLVKPFDASALVELVARYIQPVADQEDDLVAVDQHSRQLTEVARRVADTDATVMISGESGVGKEVISRFIHRHSSRAAGPFVAINCAAIPENMLESVLFGYEKGAFTGAHQATPGKFELAQGGTLLLDEITEMDLALQAKLLRVLQEREVERIGGRKPIPLDVRILATTNRSIRKVVDEGLFREDLYYRLNVFPLKMMPLRDRCDDILPLARRLLRSNDSSGSQVSFSVSAEQAMLKHAWPGNVRELDNVIQRALILKTGNLIDASDLHFEKSGVLAHMTSPQAETNHQPSADEVETLNADLKTREQELILSALKAKRSRTEVAAKLGISPRTLRYKLAKLRDAGVALPA
jgi:two-component system response regulator FlrC